MAKNPKHPSPLTLFLMTRDGMFNCTHVAFAVFWGNIALFIVYKCRTFKQEMGGYKSQMSSDYSIALKAINMWSYLHYGSDYTRVVLDLSLDKSLRLPTLAGIAALCFPDIFYLFFPSTCIKICVCVFKIVLKCNYSVLCRLHGLQCFI